MGGFSLARGRRGIRVQTWQGLGKRGGGGVDRGCGIDWAKVCQAKGRESHQIRCMNEVWVNGGIQLYSICS